jgi:hypothetical protein
MRADVVEDRDALADDAAIARQERRGLCHRIDFSKGWT